MPGEMTRRLGRSALGRRMAARLDQLAATVRRVAGMPDYKTYVRHCRDHHPGRAVPTEREFFDQYLESRYGSGPTRCC
jgi:uncharacterized short protein YbdD (DUF466 family)